MSFKQPSWEEKKKMIIRKLKKEAIHFNPGFTKGYFMVIKKNDSMHYSQIGS